MGSVWRPIVGCVFAFFFLGVIGFLIYRFCLYRRQKSIASGMAPMGPTGPQMGNYPNASAAPYPTGPSGFPTTAAATQPQPPYPSSGAASQVPYPTGGGVPQSGPTWGAPGSAWTKPESPPPPYRDP